jgi:hypothetical protein
MSASSGLQPISFTNLPERAQALILQHALGKQTPRELRIPFAGSSHIINIVIPKACQDGMEVSVEEEARATSCIAACQRIMIANLAQRFFRPAEAGQAEISQYFGRIKSESARQDREALLDFFTEIMSRLPVPASKATFQSAIIAGDTLTKSLEQLQTNAPHNLHNILLIYNRDRRQLLASYDQFFQALPSLTKGQLAKLGHHILVSDDPEENDEAVSQLVFQWGMLFSQAGQSTQRDQRKQLIAYLESQQISHQSLQHTSRNPVGPEQAIAPLEASMKKRLSSLEECFKIGPILSQIAESKVLPTLLPRIACEAKRIFGGIPSSEISHSDRWSSYIRTDKSTEQAQHHVKEYLESFPSLEREKRKAALAFLTHYSEVFLPQFFPVLKQAPMLFPYLIPAIQAQLVDILDKEILPPLESQCPAVFHNILVAMNDPGRKGLQEEFAEFCIHLFTLAPGDRRGFTERFLGAHDTPVPNDDIDLLMKKWSVLKEQDTKGDLTSVLAKYLQHN